MKTKTQFYEIAQNNTGGSFITNDTLCHRLFIEASSEAEALDKAENLGCYWNGVEDGMDCPCCGNRWYPSSECISLNTMNKRWGGYEISKWGSGQETSDDLINSLKTQYKEYEWLTEPSVSKKFGSKVVTGKIKLKSIEQYAQILADLYGWTSPDCRIFYRDGSVKEIFSNKL